jgi:hypothetical protein
MGAASSSEVNQARAKMKTLQVSVRNLNNKTMLTLADVEGRTINDSIMSDKITLKNLRSKLADATANFHRLNNQEKPVVGGGSTGGDKFDTMAKKALARSAGCKGGLYFGH